MKYSALARLVLCLFAAHLFAQPNDGSPQNQSEPTPHAQAAPSPQNTSEASNQAKTSETSAPRWYASSEWWLVIIAALTGFTIGYQAREMRRATSVMEGQLKEMKATSEQTAKELELTHRPWLSVEPTIISPLVFDSEGLNIRIRFSVKNVGNSPAMKAGVTPVLVFEGNQTLALVHYERLRERLMQESGPLSVPDLLGITLFPGDSVHPEIAFKIDPSIIADALDQHAHKFIRPILVGFVYYRFSFADGFHETPFIWDVRQHNAANPDLPLMIDTTRGTLPLSGDDRVEIYQHVPGPGDAT